MMPLLFASVDNPPAGGTAASEIIAASVVAFAAVVVLAVIGVLHRRRGLLTPLARVAERRTGLPAWSIIPVSITAASLACAVWGYYWDVSWHIDRGRDPGAFANPAHWFIIIGLDGIAFAGLLAVLLGDRKTSTSVEVRPGWHVPVGGVMLAVCGVIALAGFPLDDIWHRLFGQDVTAWGPTHIEMIGGASLATLAAWALGVEGFRNRTRAREGPAHAPSERQISRFAVVRDITSGGAFLIGLSTLQIEFDFGVPQFRLLYHPVLLALGAAVALVAVRIRAGRGAALGATAMFLALNGLLSFVIADVMGRSTMHFPLYVVEAVVVEAVALFIPRSRQLTLGAVAGLGIGTLGFAAEWWWSRVWMPIPWNNSLLPAAVVLAIVAGVAGGVLGGLVGRALAPDGVARQRTPRGVATAAWLGAFVCLAVPLPMQAHTDWRASVAFEEIPGPARQAFVTVRLDPPTAADDAGWFDVTSWQGERHGDGGLVLADLQRVAPGVYRTDRAVPLDGTWKTIVRLETPDSLQAIPLYLPDDPAIPAPAVAVQSGQTVQFQRDKSILQREALTDNVWLERGAYLALLGLALAWLASLAWGLRRLDRGVETAAWTSHPEPHVSVAPDGCTETGEASSTSESSHSVAGSSTTRASSTPSS